MSDISTIKLEKNTKSRLDKFKIHKRETYDEIVQKLLGILNICRADPDRAQDKLIDIEKRVRAKEQDNEDEKVKGKIERFK